MRVQNHPILQFQHGKKVTFTFEGATDGGL